MTIKTPAGSFAQQIAQMSRLKAQAAAWLTGVPVSTLRDNAHRIAPNADGTYDARELLKFATKRLPESLGLSDGTVERIMQCAEHLARALSPAALRRFVELNEIIDRHESAAAGLAMTCMLGECQELLGDCDVSSLPDERYSVVCEKCEQVRHGRTWSKKLKRESTYFLDVCPNCSDT